MSRSPSTRCSCAAPVQLQLVSHRALVAVVPCGCVGGEMRVRRQHADVPAQSAGPGERRRLPREIISSHYLKTDPTARHDPDAVGHLSYTAADAPAELEADDCRRQPRHLTSGPRSLLFSADLLLPFPTGLSSVRRPSVASYLSLAQSRVAPSLTDADPQLSINVATASAYIIDDVDDRRGRRPGRAGGPPKGRAAVFKRPIAGLFLNLHLPCPSSATPANNP
jgi:hypothetical protein